MGQLVGEWEGGYQDSLTWVVTGPDNQVPKIARKNSK